MKTVLIDLDGVCVASLPTWLAEYNRLSGEYLRLEDITSYGFEKLVRNPTLFFKCLQTGKVFARSMPMDGALAGVQLWAAHDDVYFVTYSHEDCDDGHAQKLAWMRMWLPWVREEQVGFIKQKYRVRGDVLIEDAPQNIEAWLAENPHGWAYLVDHPYNRDYSAARVTRVASVEEAYWHHAGQPLDQSFAATFNLTEEFNNVR